MYVRVSLWLLITFYLNFLFIDSLYVKLKLFDRAPTLIQTAAEDENRFFNVESAKAMIDAESDNAANNKDRVQANLN